MSSARMRTMSGFLLALRTELVLMELKKKRNLRVDIFHNYQVTQ